MYLAAKLITYYYIIMCYWKKEQNTACNRLQL